MKTIITIIAVSLVCFSSCTKEEFISPELRIYVTTLASEKYSEVDIKVNSFEFITTGYGSKSVLHQYTPYGYSTFLSKENTVLIDVVDISPLNGVSGVKMDLSIPILYEGEILHQDIQIPYFVGNDLISPISFEPGKTYQIDFTIDLDELLYEYEGDLHIFSYYSPAIRELK